jgi:hypothetical protein
MVKTTAAINTATIIMITSKLPLITFDDDVGRMEEFVAVDAVGDVVGDCRWVVVGELMGVGVTDGG